MLVNGGWGISYEIALRWMPLDLADDKSTLVQVMAWCRQAKSHYLSQGWPRSMPPNGVTRPQWAEVADEFQFGMIFFLLNIPVALPNSRWNCEKSWENLIWRWPYWRIFVLLIKSPRVQIIACHLYKYNCVVCFGTAMVALCKCNHYPSYGRLNKGDVSM